MDVVAKQVQQFNR